MGDLPVFLYKYFPPARISVLADQLVSFSTLAQFNDPLEGLSPSVSLFPAHGPGSLIDRASKFDLSRQAYKKIFENAVAGGATVEHADHLARTIANNDAVVAHVAEQLPKLAAQYLATSGVGYRDFESEIAEHMGVFSLSATALSPPMRAHYAKNYEGFILEISAGHEFFRRLPYMTLQPVTYQIRKLDHFMAMDASDLFLRKAVDWTYEQEWRSFRLIEDADRITESGHHLFRLPSDAIQGIILGERASEPLLDAARREAHLKQWTLSKVVADKHEKTLALSPMNNT